MPDSPFKPASGFYRPTAPPGERVPLGAAGIDGVLGGGLTRGRLHEIWPAGPDDGSSALGFTLMLALRAAGAAGTILWLAEDAAERPGRGWWSWGSIPRGCCW